MLIAVQVQLAYISVRSSGILKKRWVLRAYATMAYNKVITEIRRIVRLDSPRIGLNGLKNAKPMIAVVLPSRKSNRSIWFSVVVFFMAYDIIVFLGKGRVASIYTQ